MAFFSDEWIHDLLQKVNIADLVGEYVSLQNKSGRWWACCPFHNEKTPSFSVNTDKGFFHCFGCGKGGNAIHFVMEQEKMTFPEACTYLAEKVGLAIPENTGNEQYEKRKAARKKIVEMNKIAAHYFHGMLHSTSGMLALEYLHARGISDRIIKIFGLGFAPDSWDDLMIELEKKGYTKQEMQTAGLIKINDGKSYNLFRNRVMMPIINTFSDVIGFGGRVLDDGLPKYLNSPETAAFNKSRNLYNLNMVRKQKNLQDLILVEGYMDVIALYMHGITNCVATLGTALTADQARLVKRYVSKVYISYDGDSAGKKATLRALGVLEQAGLECRVIGIPGGEDPDDFLKEHGKEGYFQLIKEAKPVLDYQFDIAAEPYDMEDGHQRQEYTKDCISILKQVKSAVVKDQYVKNLAQRTGFSEHSIRQDLGMETGQESGPQVQEPVKRQENKNNSDEFENNLMALLCVNPDRILTVEKYFSIAELSNAVNKKIYSYLLESAKKGFLPRGDEILAVLETSEEVNWAAALLEREPEPATLGMEQDSFMIGCIKRIRLINKEREKEAVLRKLDMEQGEQEKKALRELLKKLVVEYDKLKQSLAGEAEQL